MTGITGARAGIVTRPRRLHIATADDTQALADRLRAKIARRDELSRQLAKVDAQIAIDARLWANEQGEFIRPNLDALRRRLLG